jgi:Protein of unknown function (DUF3987)
MPTATTSILDGARLLARHGGVVEVRIPGTRRGTIAGYFTDREALAAAVRPWDGTANIYITLNPVLPDLLARAQNRLKEFARVTTADAQITQRVWFPVDLDPARPVGIAATDAEVAAAATRRDELVAFLGALGFPAPVTAMSGNGGHALWAVDLPNDAATTALMERALKALAGKFTDPAVDIDRTVFNAARIWKAYGTTAVKGDATAERPHRRAHLEHVPDPLVTVDRGLLERLAALAPSEPSVGRNGDRWTLDLVGLFRERGAYLKPLGGGKHAVRCPWAASHAVVSGASSTCLFEPQSPGHPWGFDCKHSPCVDRTIKDVIAWLGVTSSNGSHGGGPGGPEAPWPAPLPIPDTLPAVPAFDAERLLPEGLRAWVLDIAERMQAPVDFIAISAVCALSSVVGRQLAIRPKQHDDWTVVPNLWGLAVGRAGVMKSPPMAEALKPLHRLVAQAREDHAGKMRDYEFASEAAKLRKEALKARLKEAVKAGKPTDEIRAAYEALEEPEPPTERRYMVNDATVEKLGELLKANRNGLLVFRDELSGWLCVMDREGHENDRAFYCEAWNGHRQLHLRPNRAGHRRHRGGLRVGPGRYSARPAGRLPRGNLRGWPPR